MTSFQQFMSISFMQRPCNQQDDIINLITIRDVVEELGEITDGLGTEVIEFLDHLLSRFIGDCGSGDGGRDIGEEVAILSR
jgi:hypothetical protein